MHMQIMIEEYIDGKLTRSQIELLWLEILKEPEWLDYLEIALAIRFLPLPDK